MSLNTIRAADDQNSTVQNGHSAFGLGGKVHVPRGIYQCNVQPGRLQASLLGENGDAPGLLQCVGV